MKPLLHSYIFHLRVDLTVVYVRARASIWYAALLPEVANMMGEA